MRSLKSGTVYNAEFKREVLYKMRSLKERAVLYITRSYKRSVLCKRAVLYKMRSLKERYCIKCGVKKKKRYCIKCGM